MKKIIFFSISAVALIILATEPPIMLSANQMKYMQHTSTNQEVVDDIINDSEVTAKLDSVKNNIEIMKKYNDSIAFNKRALSEQAHYISKLN